MDMPVLSRTTLMQKKKRKKLSSKDCKAISERLKGSHNPRWNEGKYINKGGYVFIRSHDHPYADVRGYVFEHRLVMEKHIGRHLLPTEIVHHIDGNVRNNTIENLMLYSSHAVHMKEHMLKIHAQRREQNGTNSISNN